MKAKFFNGPELESAFKLLVTELEARGIETDIYVVGGAAFLFRAVKRRATVDIDAKISNYAAVTEVAKDLALTHAWPKDWINNSASIFIPLDTDYNKWEPYYASHIVRVWIAPLEDLLIMKLIAARPNRDIEDIAWLLESLKLDSVEQVFEIFERRVKGSTLSAKAVEIVELVLAVTNE